MGHSEIWLEGKRSVRLVMVVPEVVREISGFRHEIDGNCTLLGCYLRCSGNFLPTFLNNILVPS